MALSYSRILVRIFIFVIFISLVASLPMKMYSVGLVEKSADQMAAEENLKRALDAFVQTEGLAEDDPVKGLWGKRNIADEYVINDVDDAILDNEIW